MLAAAPNPFAAGTTIHYTLATSAEMDLSVFDVAGRQVRQLARGRTSAGEHATHWDGRNDAGQRVSPGVYLYRLGLQGSTETKRVIVLE